MILTTQDFKADYRIAISSTNSTKVNELIEEYEPMILRNLLGSVIYTELKNSTLGGGVVVPSIELEYIFSEFDYDNGGCEVHSDGIVKMLALMLYFYIARQPLSENTPLGNRNNVAEVSDSVNNMMPVVAYNKGANTYNAIQYYIKNNISNYPDFKGKPTSFASII